MIRRHQVALILAMLSLAACADPTMTAPVPPSSPLKDLTLVIVPLPAPTDFVEITGGAWHTCARQFRGNVYCWGYNAAGQVGTVGSDPSRCSGFFCVIQPTFVTYATSVDAGDNQTCSLNSGPASCWGGSSEFTPRAVPGSQSFSSISAGSGINCGTTFTGIYCWGITSTGIGSPAQITSNGSFSRIAVAAHGCAMLGADVACWGPNTHGETTQDPAMFQTVPVTMGTLFGSAVSRVSTAGQFTCVDQQSGIVQCAGTNTYGQLGNGRIPVYPNPEWTNVPQTVMFPPPPPTCTSIFGCFKQKPYAAQLHGVSAGWTHACALDANGYAYCWGNGTSGQLGNGGFSTSAYPVAVAGGHTYRAIAAGVQHTCAIGTDNLIYCWGDGMVGQLGTGLTSDSSPVPKPTGALRPWITPTA